MEITFLGAGTVRLTSRNLAILVNPYSKDSGLPEIKATNDLTLLSQQDMTPPAKPGMVIDGPGEYEVKGAMITGVAARLHTDREDEGQRATVYTVMLDGVHIAVTGNIAAKLSDSQVEAIGQVDVLVVPVGGHGLTLGAEDAAGLVSQLEPKYVVPVHYEDGTTKYPMPQSKLDDFLKEMGAKPEPQAKLRVTAKDLPLETTVVSLNRQTA